MKVFGLPTVTLYVKKTGLPFYDSARLIGVAHLFFGTTSAEVEDKGMFWIVKGSKSTRDKDQILWTIDNLLVPKAGNVRKKVKDLEDNFTETFLNTAKYFEKPDDNTEKDIPLMAMDAALLTGIRGVDPLSSYSLLAPQTGTKGAKFEDYKPEIIVSTLGLSYAARARFKKARQNEIYLILPIFAEHFVLSNFLNFKKDFSHQAGGFITTVWTALSILIDLEGERIPVVDFAYNKIVEQTFYESGYLGFRNLCSHWQTGGDNMKRALREVKLYLERTSWQDIPSQHLDLARVLAQSLVNPNIGRLELIEKLKARIMTSLNSDDQNARRCAFWVTDLLSRKETIEEVIVMCGEEKIEIPEGLTWAVANALIPPNKPPSEAKGWFNSFVKLENATTADRFVSEVERLVSRATYVSETPEKAYFAKSEELEILRSLAIMRDDRKFRAFKAVFLLEVLSKLRRGAKEPETQISTSPEMEST